jgi:diguanylate cyclase (GGDEF)-like protein
VGTGATVRHWAVVDSSAAYLAEGVSAFDLGRADEALALAEAGMRIAATEHERFELQRLGTIALHRLGRTRDAFDLAEDLLPRSPAISPAAVADVAAVLGVLADQLGDPALAIERTSLALDQLAAATPDDPAFLRASNNVAHSVLRFGAYHLAAEMLSIAQAYCADDERLRTGIHMNLARAELRLADRPVRMIEPSEQQQRLERVLAITGPYLDDHRPRRVVEAASLAAPALLGLDRAAAAERTIDRAVGAAGEITDPRAMTDFEIARSRTLRARGKLRAAAVAADRAVIGAELADDPVMSALALDERSRVAEAAGDTASALADLRASNQHNRYRHAGRYDSLMRHVQHRAALRAARQDAEARATSLAQSVADLRELVNHDHLTGLPNRRAFDADAERQARRAGVIMADIDHFKGINDARGHLIGDAVLQLVARTIAGTLRDRGVAYRWGGEEFVVVVGDIHAADTTLIAGELREAISTAPWFSVAPGLTVTMSVGAAIGPADTLRELVAQADDALYRAKADGRDRVATAES